MNNATQLIRCYIIDDIEGNRGEDELTDLHNAHRIETCVAEGELGVGEMDSIWVTDAALSHVACAFLSRRLFLLLDSGNIVGGLLNRDFDEN